jgi:hypothetical protein
MLKYVDIDFEFNSSADLNLNLVCCCYKLSDTGEEGEQWLFRNAAAYALLAKKLEAFRDQGYKFRAFGATAECRSILSMKTDPRRFDWIDLYLEWRQLQNCNDEFNYGTYFAHGEKLKSEKPHRNPRRNQGRNMVEISAGIVGCVGRLLEISRDSKHKDDMRDLILSNPEEFTPDEKRAILDYCHEDVRDLAAIHEAMEEPLSKMTGLSPEEVLEVQFNRGRYAANLAHMERSGFPIDMDALENLIRNTEQIKREATLNMNTVYPFFRRKETKELTPSWSFSNAMFQKFVKESGNADKWPVSEKTKKFKKDDKTLEKYRFLPEIEALHQTNKLLRNLTWFSDYDSSRFKDSMGPDGVLRPFFGPFGTQTGRNAPPASQFILAMSSWLRVLVRPPRGRSLISIDYKSQEFAIGAICSKDENLADSYRSGDPYLAFAILCKAIPEDGTKESHPEERQLYKSVVLGLSYGMRAASLSQHIAASIGRPVSEKQANKYIKQHEKVYKTYWKWRAQVLRYYERTGRYVLSDGWTLGPDNNNGLSVQNFPVQGVAQCVLRLAMDKAMDRGIEVISGLHDAIYAMADQDQAEDQARILGEAMTEAVQEELWTEGMQLDIGLDVEIHHHEDDWIEDKGRRDYENYNKFLKHMSTDEDKENKIKELFYPELMN